MKKMTLIRSIATIGLFLVAGSAIAQTANPQVITALPTYNILTDSSYVSPDYATAGAQMPYFVNKDPFFRTHPTMFNASGFAWTIDGGLTLTTTTGGALSPFGGGLFADTMVMATYASAGSYNITVYEQSRPKNGTGCQGATRSLAVTVFDKPSMALSGSDTIGGCTLSANYPITYNFTVPAAAVSDSVYVSYTLQAYDFSGTAVGTAQNYIAKVATGDPLQIYSDQMADAAGTSPSPAPAGAYKVFLTNLWDEVSVRALNRSNAAVYTDPATTEDVVIMLYPTPATAPIKHIRKL